MGLCGSSRCACGVTTDGTIDISGSGESGDPYVLGMDPQWFTFTPTVDQGVSTDISKTVVYSKFVQIGNVVTWAFRLDLTGAGTSGSSITATLPVAPVVNSFFGVGYITDLSGTNLFDGTLILADSTHTHVRTGYSAYAGDTFAAASGDIFRGSVTYEAA